MNETNKKVLGIDYGDKRIGLAVSDGENKIVLPYEVIINNNFVEQLKNICEKENIGKIVIGLPLALSGEDTEQTKKVRSVVEALKKELTIPVETEDERMTTKLAEAIDRGFKTGKKDANVAAIILQSYLDKTNK